MPSDRIALGSYECDVRTGHVSLSASLRQIAGLTDARNLTTAEFIALAHPDDRAAVVAATTAGSGAKAPAALCRFLRPSGETRWTVLRAETIRNGDGEAQKIVGLVFDTSWGHDAYRSVLTSLADQQAPDTVFREAPAALVLCGAGRTVDVNDALTRLLGYTREDASRPSGQDAGLWERLRLPDVTSQIAATGRFQDQVWRVRARDQRTHLVLVSAAPVAALGRHAVLVAFNEAAMRFETQSLLAESEERVSRLAGDAPEGLLFLEKNVVLDCNEYAAVALGYSVEDLRGTPLVDLLDGAAVESARAWLADDRAGPRAISMRHHDGHLRLFEVTPRVADREDRKLRILALRDQSERQRADVAVRALKDTQESEAEEREKRRQAEAEVHSLAEQLRHAQRLEAIGRLAGGVAHDFNNLLSVINGYAERLLKQLPENHPMAALVKPIASAGHRGSELTQRLLAFSRRQVLAPRIISPNDIVRDLVPMLKPLVGAQITLDLELDPEAGAVHADPAQIEQVVMNLATNARDAMTAGGTLTIATRNVTLTAEHSRLPSGPYVEIAVRDTGHGIDPEMQAHIFEPFFTTKERGRGTGLGLPMAYGIVTQSGGDVRVESEVGHGTTMRVRLPLVTGDPTQAPVPAAVEESPPGGSETLLLVEDDENVRELVADFLRGAGYLVIEAGNGADAEALCSAEERRIDLLVSDVVLPGLDGPTLSARLRSLVPGLKTLLMSGYPGSATVRPSAESATMFIAKPFSRAALLTKVREALS